MTTTTEQKNAGSLRAVEFLTQVGDDRAIRLPADLTLPSGRDVRVLVLWQKPLVEYDDETDEEWATLGAHMMANGYEEDPVDDDYSDLLKG